MVINYEELVADYNDKLLTKLRSHGSSFEYLEMWVPDENPVKSILNMVEAAESSGKQDIQVSVSNNTFADSDVNELIEEINKIGAVSIQEEGNRIILNVTELQTDTLSILDNLDVSLHKGFLEIAEQIDHQGEIDLFNKEIKYDAIESGVRLSLAIADGIITRAAFSGDISAQEKVIMETFCRVIEDIPLQEAADHGALTTLYRLYDKEYHKPVDGIMMVENVDPMFIIPQNLIREINEMYKHKNSIDDVSNYWNPHLSKDWLILSKQGKIERIIPIVNDFLKENSLGETDIYIENIDKDVRVIVSLSENISSEAQPEILMKLEQKIRAITGKRLEIYTQERQDENKIRRITIN